MQTHHPMAAVIDSFIPQPDVRERHETVVRAPAELVLEVARRFDVQSIPLVRTIFWLRGKLLRAKAPASARPKGLDTDALRAMGWGVLAEVPGRSFVAGAACQPWQADVVFTPIAPDRFAAYVEPDRVKIAWTLEVEALGPALSRFATETRAVATDAQARAKFRRYWRYAGIGILAIRWLLVPAVRRQAEGRRRAEAGAASLLQRPSQAAEAHMPSQHSTRIAAIGVWACLLGFAIVNSLFQGFILEPNLGPEPAHFLATTTLAGAVIMASLLWIGTSAHRYSVRGLMEIGAIWLVLTVAFELSFGRLALGLSWGEILADYDISRGRLFGIVLLAEGAGPLLIGIGLRKTDRRMTRQ